MGDLVNLKRFKKRVVRDQSAKQADSNRARHGRTRLERERDEVDKDRTKMLLDQHRLDDKGAP